MFMFLQLELQQFLMPRNMRPMCLPAAQFKRQRADMTYPHHFKQYEKRLTSDIKHVFTLEWYQAAAVLNKGAKGEDMQLQQGCHRGV